MDFEYVASGPSFYKIGFKEVVEDKSLTDFYSSVFSTMRQKSNKNNHGFSLLYNAWTEPSHGAIIHDYFKKDLDSIYADSGGLQVITCGKNITPELKLDVYRHQAGNSDYGMCFDEIPLTFSGTSTKSGRNDTQSRIFDISKVDHYAKETGKNVLEQINLYLDEKTSTKPVIILHGNCYDTFMQWFDGVMSEIPYDKQKYIGAIAMSGASIGSGALVDIERAFIFSQLQTDIKHLHLLGLGSIKRALPFIIFKQNELLKDVRISYDSTTHTSGPHMGRYFMNGNTFEITRGKDHRYQLIYDDINSKFDMGLTVDEFFKGLNLSTRQHDDVSISIKSVLSFIMSSIDNFVESFNAAYMNPNLHKELDIHMYHIYNIKNKVDYDLWYKEASRFIKSKRISSAKTESVESLFV